MYSSLKIILIIIFSIFITLFILFGLLYFLYILKYISYIYSFAIQETSVQLSILIFIFITTLFLIQWHKQIKWWMAFLYCFIFFIISFITNISLIEKRITDIAINKYGVEPSYLSINFDIDAEFKEPHAVVYKKGKTYYWSFSKNDFILNTNPNLHL